MALVSRWYLAPYEEVVSSERPRRRVIVDRVTAQVRADGGSWTEAEANGVRATGPGWAIVKVRAEPATHALVAALPGVRSVPASMTPNTSLGTLTNNQRNTLRTAPARKRSFGRWFGDTGWRHVVALAVTPAGQAALAAGVWEED